MLTIVGVNAQTTQKGMVKEYNVKARKTPLAGVELNIRSANSTVSDKNGAFTLIFPTLNAGARVKVRNVWKVGYEIFNKDAVEQWNINPNEPFDIVMCRSDRFKAICDNYYSKASANYDKQLAKDKAAVERLKVEGKLKEEEYNKRIDEIKATYNQQLESLDNYIDRFARIDLSNLQAEEQEIIELVQEGRFDEAIAKYDALNLKEKYRNGLNQEKKEAEAIERLQYEHRVTQNANKETFASIRRNVETLELAGGRENIEKAIAMLHDVAEMDSLNVELLIMTGDYTKNYFADYQAAILYYKKALDISFKNNGESHPLTCKANTCIGEIYIATKEFPIAMKYLNKALEQWKINGDLEHPDIADLYNDLGVTLRSMGQNDKALEYYNKAINIWKETKGRESLHVAVGLHNIGMVQMSLGQFNDALDSYLQAAAMCEKVRGLQHPTVGFMYNGVGSILYYLGNFPKAIEYLNKAIDILSKSMSSDDPNLALLYDNIGRCHVSLGQYDDGVDYYNKSLTIKLKKFSESNLHVALTYSHLGVAYKSMGNIVKAEECLSKALKIQEAKLAPDHADLAASYINLGTVYSDFGEYDYAIEYQKKGLNIMEKTKGPNHLEVAQSYNNLAGTYSCMGDYNKALEFYNKALTIKESKLGTDHPDIALCYNNIGNTYGKKGDYDKAMKYLEKAKSICEKADFKSNHPSYAAILRNISEVQSLINAKKKK